jgi:hypothetical protein
MERAIRCLLEKLVTRRVSQLLARPFYLYGNARYQHQFYTLHTTMPVLLRKRAITGSEFLCNGRLE